MNERNHMRSYCELQLEYKTSKIELKTVSEILNAYSRSPEKKHEEFEKLKKQHESKQIIVDVYKNSLKQMEREIAKAAKEFEDDTMLRVFHLRYVKGKSLVKIAKQLHYSEIRIKQIHKEIKKIIRKKT